MKAQRNLAALCAFILPLGTRLVRDCERNVTLGNGLHN